MTYNEHRPWGSYEVIAELPGYKVKKITVKPNKRLSYQLHFNREEYWHVISGTGLVTLNDTGFIIDSNTRKFFFVDIAEKHRVQNLSDTEDLVFLEIQSGDILEESDIVRFEDDFGRN